MSDSVLIATSIAPKERLEVQHAAIESWLGHGFRVRSVNCQPEIDALRPQFPDIEFVAPPRTAEALVGKPLVYVSDVLGTLAPGEAAVFGLVNSDIYIPARGDLGAWLAQECDGAMVIGQRLEVEAFDAEIGRADPFGFDCFFFGDDMVREPTVERFMLGRSNWDYWLPLEALNRGLRLKRLDPPFIRHIPHPVESGPDILVFGSYLADYFAQMTRRQAGSDPDAAAAAGFFAHHHQRLREGAERADTETDEHERFRLLAQLAEFYDSLARYAFKTIRERAAPLDWSGG